jgi:hypothetical protein
MTNCMASLLHVVHHERGEIPDSDKGIRQKFKGMISSLVVGLLIATSILVF